MRQEWQFALQADKAVTPILRQGDYPLVPDELKLLHCEDFRNDAQHAFHLNNFVRQLREPLPPLGKLITGAAALANSEWLKDYLKLPAGIPSHDTLGRLLATLKPQAFQNCFQKWIASLAEDADVETGDTQEQIAIDGKALRRSHDRRRGLSPLFLVSAVYYQMPAPDCLTTREKCSHHAPRDDISSRCRHRTV